MRRPDSLLFSALRVVPILLTLALICSFAGKSHAGDERASLRHEAFQKRVIIANPPHHGESSIAGRKSSGSTSSPFIDCDSATESAVAPQQCGNALATEVSARIPELQWSDESRGPPR